MTKASVRRLGAAVFASVFTAVPALAVAADDGAVKALHTFIDTFNKGDIAGAAAVNAPDEVIIDEPPPHLWKGPGAFQAWVADLGKDAAAKGETHQVVTLGPVVREQIDGDVAYIVMKVTFTYLQKGKPIVEPAQFVSVVAKQGGAWKI